MARTVSEGGQNKMLVSTLLSVATAGVGNDDGSFIKTDQGPIPELLAKYFCASEQSFIGEITGVESFFVKPGPNNVHEYYDISMKVLIPYRGSEAGQTVVVTVPKRDRILPRVDDGQRYLIALQTIAPLPKGWVAGQRFVGTVEYIPDGEKLPNAGDLREFADEVCDAVVW
ncbi:MAG: hypothetical protein R3F61_30765 [Myxococcota bacterium]